jgi:hypothetical protein
VPALHVHQALIIRGFFLPYRDVSRLTSPEGVMLFSCS